MRVLHLYAGNLYGGVETLLVTLARQRGLCPEMDPHFALCFEGRLSKELEESGVPMHLLGPARFSRPWTVWRARRNLAALLMEQKPDAVICHECWPHALFAPVVRAKHLPLVFWTHDGHVGRHWLERWARYTPPDFILANSRHTQSTLPSLFPAVPSDVLYCPVPPPPVLDRPAVRRAVRQALQTPEDAVVIIQACRLERWKGHTLLLQALDGLADVPAWRCWIAGGAQRPHEAAYLAELKELTARLHLTDRVQFLGQRTDVPRLLAAADIHCQPNLNPEPFGIAFVEALHAGLPVVTTAMGGALEIVDESCGILVLPEDVKDRCANSATISLPLPRYSGGEGRGEGPIHLCSGHPLTPNPSPPEYQGRGEKSTSCAICAAVRNALSKALCRLIEDERLRTDLGNAGPARAHSLCDLKTQLTELGTILASAERRGCPV